MGVLIGVGSVLEDVKKIYIQTILHDHLETKARLWVLGLLQDCQTALNRSITIKYLSSDHIPAHVVY